MADQRSAGKVIVVQERSGTGIWIEIWTEIKAEISVKTELRV
jgi:hypothetical protein